jgi:SAM-dependent methyltransferase
MSGKPQGGSKPMDSLAVVNAKTRRAYDLAAGRYHGLFHDELNGKAYDRRLLDDFAGGFGPGSLVLDAGCGPSGHIGRYIFERGVFVLGIDISGRCIESVRRHNPAMRFERGDIGKMEFGDGAFDGIIAYYSIIDTPKRHVPRIFREFHRVLKPGGRLLVAVKAGEGEGYRTELVGVDTEIYFSLFTKEEIRAFYEDEGFLVEFPKQRKPYPDEIDVERVFAIGRKKLGAARRMQSERPKGSGRRR